MTRRLSGFQLVLVIFEVGMLPHRRGLHELQLFSVGLVVSSFYQLLHRKDY